MADHWGLPLVEWPALLARALEFAGLSEEEEPADKGKKKPLIKQLERFKVLLGRKVSRIEFDKGKEFMGAVIPMLDKKKYEEC